MEIYTILSKKSFIQNERGFVLIYLKEKKKEFYVERTKIYAVLSKKCFTSDERMIYTIL